MEAKALEINGVKWQYYVSGTGHDGFLFLAGMLSAGPSIVEFLNAALPGRQVVVPVHAAVNTISEYAHAIRSMLDRENISKTAVYGASFGSLIAQCFARANTERTSHLILSGAAAPEPSQARKNQFWLGVLPFAPTSFVRMSLRMALKSLLKNSKGNQDLWLAEYAQLINNITKRDLISRYKIAIDYDKNYFFQPDDFQKSSIRMLVLEGEEDKIAGKEIREKLKTLYPNAAVHVFGDAGHSVLLTHPEEWKKVVRNFLL